MLTHSLDLRQCVNTWELSWLQRCHPFILERQVSLFSGQALAVCSQGGFQPLSSSLLPFTPSDILEPLFDGPCLYLNIAYFSVYLRMFSYVYFFQSVPCCRLHTQRQIGTQTHIVFFSFFLLQRNHCGVQTSHGFSRSVSQPVLTCSFHQGTVQCTCWRWNPPVHPRVSISLIRSLPGEEGGGVAPKTSVPRLWERGEGPVYPTLIWCEEVLRCSSWKSLEDKAIAKKMKGDLTTIRPQGPEWSLSTWQFSHIHNMTEQVWLVKVRGTKKKEKKS